MKGKVLLLIKLFIHHSENQLLHLSKRVNIDLQNVSNMLMIITQDLITAKMVHLMMIDHHSVPKNKDCKTKKIPTKMSSHSETKTTL